MSARDYYLAEQARHAVWMVETSNPEAVAAVKRLVRHYSPKEWKRYAPRVRVKRRGSTAGRAHGRSVVLPDRATWLLVAHEAAHCIDDRRRGLQRKRARWHGPRHARLVDLCVAYIRRRGWSSGVLAEGPAWKEHARRAAVRPTARQLRIVTREAQIKALDRKIRHLASYRARAKRSLLGLLRAEKAAAGTVKS